MIYAGILAGGKGTRMGNVPMPKQFLMLNDKPILIHTVEKFILNSKFKKIIIASPKEWIHHTEDLIKKYNLDLDRVVITEGGSDRNESIMNVIKFIEEQYEVTSQCILVTHDAVRPFITYRIMEDNIEQGLIHSAVDTVIPAIDTIVVSKDGSYLDEVPIRDTMFQGQTPQTFNINKLKTLYNSLSQDEKAILTDACKIFSLKGHDVKIVQGENFNIKVTTPFDLNVANAIIKGSLEK